MAKQKVFIDKDGYELILAPKFVYEVQIFKHSPNRYYLDDTKWFMVNDWVPNKHSYVRNKEDHYTRHTKLIGAPLSWLKEHNYVEQCQEKK